MCNASSGEIVMISASPSPVLGRVRSHHQEGGVDSLRGQGPSTNLSIVLGPAPIKRIAGARHTLGRTVPLPPHSPRRPMCGLCPSRGDFHGGQPTPTPPATTCQIARYLVLPVFRLTHSPHIGFCGPLTRPPLHRARTDTQPAQPMDAPPENREPKIGVGFYRALACCQENNLENVRTRGGLDTGASSRFSTARDRHRPHRIVQCPFRQSSVSWAIPAAG
jgi:hypothetical protein